MDGTLFDAFDTEYVSCCIQCSCPINFYYTLNCFSSDLLIFAKKRNLKTIIFKAVLSTLDIFASRDNVMIDVMYSISGCGYCRTTILVSIWGFSRSRNVMK